MYKKISGAVIIFVISFFVFLVAEFDLLNPAGNKIFQSLIFSSTLIVSVFLPKFKVKLLYTTFFILFFMMLLYLLNNLNYSNFLGSIGIGMLTIIIFSYLPQLLKNGEIEKL